LVNLPFLYGTGKTQVLIKTTKHPWIQSLFSLLLLKVEFKQDDALFNNWFVGNTRMLISSWLPDMILVDEKKYFVRIDNDGFCTGCPRPKSKKKE
jgi:hypothetical protein